ncbi:MAG: cytidine deaminase [Candidatus Falkowbacteria bacterium]
MDFSLRHQQGPNSVIADIIGCKNGFELLLNSGKAIILEESCLEAKSNEILKTDFLQMPCRQVMNLIKKARKSREYSYAPYSHFNVGAAILSQNRLGKRKIFNGCNVENSAYGSTVCAERVAALKAVSEGYRKFFSYAVVGGFDCSVPEKLRQIAQKEYVAPCGPCRQVTNEFNNDCCSVILPNDVGGVFITLLEFLLPLSFGPANLGLSPLEYDRHNQ